jgi:hypothetical protein
MFPPAAPFVKFCKAGLDAVCAGALELGQEIRGLTGERALRGYISPAVGRIRKVPL